MVIVSLASPEQPRERGFPQHWPKPTNFLRAKSLSFPTCQEAKRQLSECIGQGRSSLAGQITQGTLEDLQYLLTHSFKPVLSGGLGAGAGALPPPPVSASTRVEIAMPMALRFDAMINPCSQNRVRMRSASVVS